MIRYVCLQLVDDDTCLEKNLYTAKYAIVSLTFDRAQTTPDFAPLVE
jgi:hypothetical protein